MSRADLHLYSRFPAAPSGHRVRMQPPAGSPAILEAIHARAKARGMDFVTVTDRDAIDAAVELASAHPEDSFVSVAVTACFPEDGCGVQVLVYGIAERQFEHVQAIRGDIHELRDYLLAEGLAHSLAHPVSDAERPLAVEHLEKLILLFDVFEGRNNRRSRHQNEGWNRILAHLTPGIIDDLYRAHRIEPGSDEPWIKGLTGGSGDHAGASLGTTWTESPAGDPAQFLASIRQRRTDYGSAAARAHAASGRRAGGRAEPVDRRALFTHGLEYEAFGFDPDKRNAVMARYGVDPEPFTLLWAGRVSHDRNMDFMLDRLRDVRRRSTEAQLVVAGDGPALEHYREQAAGIGGVFWLGRLDRSTLQDWYSAADLLVYPGAGESFDRAVLEAQAAGLPAIVTDVGAAREIVDHGHTGYVLSLAEPKAWTQHICTLMYSRLTSPRKWNDKRCEIVQHTADRSNLRAALCGLLRPEAPAAAA